MTITADLRRGETGIRGKPEATPGMVPRRRIDGLENALIGIFPLWRLCIRLKILRQIRRDVRIQLVPALRAN